MATEPYAYSSINQQLPRQITQIIFPHSKTSIFILNTNISFKKLTISSTLESTFIELFDANNIKYILGSVYLPPSADDEDITKRFDSLLLQLLGCRFIITADINAKHPLWFSPITDIRGSLLADILLTRNVSIHNNNMNLPTFSGFHGSSFIDVTLSSTSSHNLISNWELHDELLSDHRLISFEIRMAMVNQTFNERFNFKLIDKDLFIASMQDFASEYAPPSSPSDIEAIDMKLTAAFHSAVRNSTPLINVSSKNDFVWWDLDLEMKKRDMNKIRKKYQKERNGELREHRKLEYFRAQKEYKQMIMNKKNESWKTLVDCVGNDNAFGNVYKHVRQKHRSRVICSSSIHNTIEDELLQRLQDAFPHDDISDDLPVHTECRSACESLTRLSNPVSLSDHLIDVVIQHMTNFKAPGEDNIFAFVIKLFHAHYPHVLRTFIRSCFDLCFFPARWKQTKVVFIPKPNDETKLRPISLAPMMGRILDKVVTILLVEFIDSNHLLSERQYGFRQVVSSDKALFDLKEKIMQNFDNYQYSLLISLDISGAFDNAWWPKLFVELDKLCVPSNLFNLISSFLTNRSVISFFDRTSAVYNITKGCPQGSSSGPALWNVLVNDFLMTSFESFVHVQAYADDITAVIAGSTIKEMVANSVKFLSTFREWCCASKLMLNVKKSAFMIYGKKTMIGNLKKYHFKFAERIFKLPYGDEFIWRKKQQKILGIYFDEKLTWNTHMTYLEKKANDALRGLFSLSKKTSGLALPTLKYYYNTIFVPIITYASILFIDVLDKEYISKKFKSIQRKYLLIMTHAYPSTSTEALQVLCNTSPLELECEKNAIKFQLRFGLPTTLLIDHAQVETKLKGSNYLQHIRQDIRLGDHIEFAISTVNVDSSIRACIASCVNDSFREIGLFMFPMNCGWYNAMSTALLHLLNHLRCRSGFFIRIMLTSPSLLNDIFSFRPCSEIVNSIRRCISPNISIVLREKFHPLVSWSRYRCFNCDPSHIIPMIAPYSSQYIEEEISRHLTHKWQLKWSSNTSLTSDIFPSIDSYVTGQMQLLSINFFIMPFLTGHGIFKKFVHRIGLATSPNCDTCSVLDDVNHVIFECSKYVDVTSWLGEVFHQPPTSIVELFDSCDQEYFQKLQLMMRIIHQRNLNCYYRSIGSTEMIVDVF